MIEINWDKDYKREFVCPKCDHLGMGLGGFERGKRRFRCPKCRHKTVSSYEVRIITKFKPNSNQTDKPLRENSWRTNYKGEFMCPKCYSIGMQLAGTKKVNQKSGIRKQLFKCPSCNGKTGESCEIKWTNANSQVSWRTDYKVGEFACPSTECNAREVQLAGVSHGKRAFKCAVCGTTCLSSINLKFNKLISFSGKPPAIKPFNFDDNLWDLRAINTSSTKNHSKYFANFEQIVVEWFKPYIKRYIYHQCNIRKPFASIDTKLSSLRIFSSYLAQSNTQDITQINRSLILDFYIWDKVNIEGKRQRVGVLKDFFGLANFEKWFAVDPDLILNSDFPDRERANPDPISDQVRKQIELNLHKLPDPIARMWIICFFAAMRPIEVSLLKKDCLVQEGSQWKLRWWREKGQDEHEVPISRTIAKVVQEQVDYVEQHLGKDWEYLFCHYIGVTKDCTDPSFPNLKPISRVMPRNHSPFNIAIRCLIKAENIRDENGCLADFTPRLLRHTRLTDLFNQGHDLAVVSAWAGHKDLAVTGIFYTHVSCELIAKEAGEIQVALFNSEGRVFNYESLPKTFWENPRSHELNLAGTHINTPIYGFCGLSLDEQCSKFRACYTCPCFFATAGKIPLYVKTRNELRMKEAKARENGQVVLIEQFEKQADSLDKIIAGFGEVV